MAPGASRAIISVIRCVRPVTIIALRWCSLFTMFMNASRRPGKSGAGCSTPTTVTDFPATRTEDEWCQRFLDAGVLVQPGYFYDFETEPYIVLSAILFTIGCVGVLTRRNAIVVFMCIELMLNACNLAFVAFARQHGNLDGQITAFFVMVVAAAEVVIGLAIIMTIFRTRRSASVDDASLLKY